MDVECMVQSLIADDEEHIVGFADLKNLLVDKYEGYDFGIVLGKRLDDQIIDSITPGPNTGYLDLFNETNNHLSYLANKISVELEQIDSSSIVIEPTFQHEVRAAKGDRYLRSDFSHKMAATRAGIGWIGKTDLLVSEKFGPRLRLATVLVDRPLECTLAPINESRCGDCDLCVKSCPAQAANGKSWNINTDRDEFYDAFKCRDKCIELSRERMHIDELICGICISVCPVGNHQ